MSEVSQAEFYREMRGLHTKIDDRFNALDAKLETHEKDDLKVKERVLIIETERKEEGKQAVKKATTVGLLAAIGTQIFFNLVNIIRSKV